MGWIQNVRQKSSAEKMRTIWIISGVVVILMVIAWIIVGNYHYADESTGGLFHTITTQFKTSQQQLKN